MEPRTGAERYLKDRRNDPERERSYKAARQRISQFDRIIHALDSQRGDLSQAELARKAGLRPSTVRRLFSAENPNPTLSTVVALAAALDIELTAQLRSNANQVMPPLQRSDAVHAAATVQAFLMMHRHGAIRAKDRILFLNEELYPALRLSNDDIDTVMFRSARLMQQRARDEKQRRDKAARRYAAARRRVRKTVRGLASVTGRLAAKAKNRVTDS